MKDSSTTPIPDPVPRRKDNDYSALAVTERQDFAADIAGHALPHLRGEPVPFEAARNKIENLFGFAQVPLGLAGPMIVKGQDEGGPVYVPMATTEGALVASYSRGMKLFNAGGGISARVVDDGYTQHPLFVYDDAKTAVQAARRTTELREALEEITDEATQHGSLTGVQTTVVGRRLIVQLTFTTGDALGANMAAKAADRCCRWIAEATRASRYFVHGQDVEKRASPWHLQNGRGRSVVAEGLVPRSVLRKKARAEPADLVEILRAYTVGYAQMGTQNWMVQVANGLAAILIACGQDVAYVGESSVGQLDFDVNNDGDLYASVTLPSLLLGTVGGGTNQGTAAECLDILGCRGSGRAHRLAEIVGAAVLAGDLSLMAAFCSHEFVAAHEELGRNRPTD